MVFTMIDANHYGEELSFILADGKPLQARISTSKLTIVQSQSPSNFQTRRNVFNLNH